MRGENRRIIQLLSEYGKDTEGLLENHPDLHHLYALSPQTQGLMEWLPLEKGDRILLWGARFMAVARLLLERGALVYVEEPDSDCKELLFTYLGDEKGLFAAGKTDSSFRYILLLGCTMEKNGGLPGGLRERLAPEGRLIWALDNRFGIKNICGSDHDKGAVSRKEAEGLLAEAGFEEYSFYYPMPDYRMPLELFSDRYLFREEDIAGALPVYTHPLVGEKNYQDSLCEALDRGCFGEFATSFLIVTGRAPSAVYVRYSRNRKKEYQIKTTIFEEGGRRHVEKAALYPQGSGHIEAFFQNYLLLSGEGGVSYLPPQRLPEKGRVRFDFVRGKSLGSHLAQRILSDPASLPLEEIREALARILPKE